MITREVARSIILAYLEDAVAKQQLRDPKILEALEAMKEYKATFDQEALDTSFSEGFEEGYKVGYDEGYHGEGFGRQHKCPELRSLRGKAWRG